MRLALADEHQHPLHDELISAVEAACAENRVECERISDPRREREFDVLLLLGYPHYYPSFARATRAAHRVSWFGENLPISAPTAWQQGLRALPSARLLDLAHDSLGRVVGARARVRMLRWRARAAIEREWALNMSRLRVAHPWIDELVVTSPNRVAGAHLAGWDARWVPFGYHPAMAGPLVPPEQGRRDIDVLFLGRDIHARGRRARWLADFQATLGGGSSLVVVEGGLYGADRHALLSRTRVVLDVHRVPRNSPGVRYLLSTAAGAAMVTEESDDEWLSSPENQLVAAPLNALADAVRALLDDENRRRRLVLHGQTMLQTELSMARCVRKVVEGGESAWTA